MGHLRDGARAHVAPAWGATWETSDGKSGISKDPHWPAMLQWQKKFVDAIGYAPFPVDDSQPGLYGAGYVTGNTIGIPKTSTGDRSEAAWQLIKYFATDTGLQAFLSNELRNVPTTVDALQSSALKPDPLFAKFLEIYQNPGTTSTPATASGSANQDMLTAYVDKYQAGSGGDLKAGLVKVDKAIDDQLAQSDGGAP